MRWEFRSVALGRPPSDAVQPRSSKMAAAEVMILPCIDRAAPCKGHARFSAEVMERGPFSDAMLDMSENDSLLNLVIFRIDVGIFPRLAGSCAAVKLVPSI
jgi:hypothetical protein